MSPAGTPAARPGPDGRSRQGTAAPPALVAPGRASPGKPAPHCGDLVIQRFIVRYPGTL